MVPTEEDERNDPVLGYLARAEYQALGPAERNQRALERYISGQKSNWQIGRDFERFIRTEIAWPTDDVTVPVEYPY